MKLKDIDRNIQPPFESPDGVAVLDGIRYDASNGVLLHCIDSTKEEMVRLSLVFRAGTSMDSTPFVASAALNMLSEGSKGYSAEEIAEKLDFYGAYYDASIDRDYAVVTVCCLSKFFPQTLEVFADMVLNPLFPDKELRTYASKRKERLAIERSKISFVSRELFAQSLFGPSHPYGVSHDKERYDDLAPEVLKKFYSRHYTAGNCFAVSSGLISEENRALMLGLLERLPAGEVLSPPDMGAILSTPRAEKRMGEGLQVSIRVGRVLFPRMHPDFIPMQVLSTVLGGYFGSHLVKNLREKHGYTYGVFSAMVNLDSSGYLAIATEVGAEVKDKALKEIFREMELLRTKFISGDELSTVKNIMTGEMMRILDGPFGIADVMIENLQNNTDNGYISRFISEVRKVTPERLKEVAMKYFDPKDFIIVIVG